jgi:hypothetical protein
MDSWSKQTQNKPKFTRHSVWRAKPNFWLFNFLAFHYNRAIDNR